MEKMLKAANISTVKRVRTPMGDPAWMSRLSEEAFLERINFGVDEFMILLNENRGSFISIGWKALSQMFTGREVEFS